MLGSQVSKVFYFVKTSLNRDVIQNSLRPTYKKNLYNISLIYLKYGTKISKNKKLVEKELSCSAHSMDHVVRVYNLSLHLAENENVDLDVLKASALLHDIARVKEDNDHTGKIDHAILSSDSKRT